MISTNLLKKINYELIFIYLAIDLKVCLFDLRL